MLGIHISTTSARSNIVLTFYWSYYSSWHAMCTSDEEVIIVFWFSTTFCCYIFKVLYGDLIVFWFTHLANVQQPCPVVKSAFCVYIVLCFLQSALYLCFICCQMPCISFTPVSGFLLLFLSRSQQYPCSTSYFLDAPGWASPFCSRAALWKSPWLSLLPYI